jgi:hypothetical protein
MRSNEHTVAAGAGWAGDRFEPAVLLAASGEVDAIALECLAERTLVAGLRARRANPEAGADSRLRRRFAPLLPVAVKNQCRVISNLGSANPAAGARQVVRLARELGLPNVKVAALVGDDVLPLRDEIAWERPIDGELLGAHAYVGMAGIVEAVEGGAAAVITGRVADSALFAAELIPYIDSGDAALAGAIAVGHLLECSGQLTGGNYEPPGGGGLSGAELASLGYPLAHVAVDGTAEIGVLNDAPGIVDEMTCTLQLLYEVHDPGFYITPDATIDFTGIRFEQIARNRVRMSGARIVARPTHLKVIGYVESRGLIADAEIGFAGPGALDRARRAADTLRLRLREWAPEDIVIDLVGVNSILGAASDPLVAPPPELRVHVSARCDDVDAALLVEDEIIGLTIVGPAGAAGIRSERRPRVETVTGLIPRERVTTSLVWEVS